MMQNNIVNNQSEKYKSYSHLNGFSAMLLIFFGFSLITFSILTYSSILFFILGCFPGLVFICTGFLIINRYIKALNIYNVYLMGGSSLQQMSDIFFESKNSIEKEIKYMSDMGVMAELHSDDLGNIYFGEKKEQAEPVNTKEIMEEVKEDNSFIEWKNNLEVIKNAEQEFKSEDISFSLYKMAKVLEQILTYLDAHPNKAVEVKKLMDFHLPSTLKLVDAYRELQKSGINSFSVNKTKEDVLIACDKIIEAFQGVLQDLYEDTAIDVSSDITVLKMMLAREGFLDRDVFKTKK